MKNEKFSFQKFIEDSKNAVLNPKEHFTTLSTTGGFGEPVIKAVIYGFIAGVFALLWSLLNISGGSGLGGIFGGAVGIMAFVGAIIGALIGLFIGGVIVLIISSICSGSNDYEANVRVVAAMMVLMPINAFLNIFDGVSPVLGNLLGLLVNLYGLWMLYNALNQTLKAKEETSKIIAIVLGALVLLFSIIGYSTRKGLNKLEKKLGDYEELGKEYEKAAKKMADNFEEAAKEMAETTEEMTDEITEADSNNEGDFELTMENGESVKKINELSVTSTLKNLGSDNNFAVLSRNGFFIQTALDKDGYVVEYNDDSGYYRSVESDISYKKVVAMFLGFLNEETSWKEIIEWEAVTWTVAKWGE